MRLQLARATDLAVRALVVLGDADYRTPGTELADRIGTTPGLLPQIMRPLIGRGWVDSVRGPQGGYTLAVPLHDIGVLAVIDAVEGPSDTGECVLADQVCTSQLPCALHDAWQRARATLLSELATMSISALTIVPGGGPPHASQPLRSPRSEPS